MIHRKKYDYKVRGERTGKIKAYCETVCGRGEATTELAIIECELCREISVKELEDKIRVLKRITV